MKLLQLLAGLLCSIGHDLHSLTGRLMHNLMLIVACFDARLCFVFESGGSPLSLVLVPLLHLLHQSPAFRH